MADKKISALTAATTPLAGTEVLPIVQSGSTVKVSVENFTATQNKLGVGVTPAAWGTSVVKGFQIGTGASFSGGQGYVDGFLGINSYYDGSNWKYLTTAGAKQIALTPAGGTKINRAVSGAAGANITWVTDFTFDENGNLVQGTAAKGVNFTANTPAAGMTSQLLNWYEEGTWTPVIVGSTSAGTGTYTTQTGRYTRIGRTVHFTAYVVWTAHTGTGNMYISGLPFASENTANIFFQFAPFSSNLAYTANSQLQLLLFNNATTLNFYQVNGGAAASQVAVDTAADVLVTGTYSM